MSDSWEDWENDDFEVPVLNVPTMEQFKRLQEQKLIEDSEIDLARDLICNKKEEDKDLEIAELKNLQQPTKFTQIPNNSFKKNKSKKTNFNQKEYEAKQKETSKKLKEDKSKKEKAREIFGEAEEDDEYAEYEDMFY